jgi:hypothetical protein
MERLLTMPETAAMLRAPVETLRQWRKVDKGAEGIRVGRRVLYRESDVWAWVEAQRQPRRAVVGR